MQNVFTANLLAVQSDQMYPTDSFELFCSVCMLTGTSFCSIDTGLLSEHDQSMHASQRYLSSSGVSSTCTLPFLLLLFVRCCFLLWRQSFCHVFHSVSSLLPFPFFNVSETNSLLLVFVRFFFSFSFFPPTFYYSGLSWCCVKESGVRGNLRFYAYCFFSWQQCGLHVWKQSSGVFRRFCWRVKLKSEPCLCKRTG